MLFGATDLLGFKPEMMLKVSFLLVGNKKNDVKNFKISKNIKRTASINHINHCIINFNPEVTWSLVTRLGF